MKTLITLAIGAAMGCVVYTVILALWEHNVNNCAAGLLLMPLIFFAVLAHSWAE